MTLKDWPKVYRKIAGMRSLDEHEKILFARSPRPHRTSDGK